MSVFWPWKLYRAMYAAALEVVVVAAQTKDFTKAFEPPSFKIDDDVFFGRKKLNGGAAMKFAQMADTVDEESTDPQEMADMLKRLFRLTLRTSSYKRMAARIDATLGAHAQAMLDELDPDTLTNTDEDDDREDADVLDLMQVNEIGEWLLGEYGLRPTEPSEPSSSGPDSPESGTSSTETPSP